MMKTYTPFFLSAIFAPNKFIDFLYFNIFWYDVQVGLEISIFIFKHGESTECTNNFHLNISSLTKHFDELNTLLTLLELQLSVIGITETKFSKNITPSINFSLPIYSIEHTPAESSAGGALLYIADYLTYKQRKDLTKQTYKSKELESIFIEIMYKKKKKVIIGCLYKHPCMPIDEFNDEFLLPLLEKASKENKKLILLGDFNINLLKSDTENFSFKFLRHSRLLLTASSNYLSNKDNKHF